MFIISPRIGLCNQLQTIVKGILLSIKYNKNIYIDKFQIDLKSYKLCDINFILDIEQINDFLKKKVKTSIKILNKVDENITNNLDSYVLPNIDYTKIPTMSYINDDIELNKNMEIIYLGNIVSLDIYKTFNYEYNNYSDNNLYYLIMTNIKFKCEFYKIKNFIKEELKLNNFNCVHLRIEDDALSHFSMCYNLSIEDYNKQILNFYNNNITNLGKNQIYISSGMLDFNNSINNKYYENIMKNNNLLCDKKNINIDNYYLNNRELIAIIDLLIAYDSENFVGCHISSFSQVIKCYFKLIKNKDCILFTPLDA